MKFNRVHAVCNRLRDQKCRLCPARFKDERYGWMIHGCYGLAKELMNIVTNGHPWSKKAPVKHIRAWRKQFNREYSAQNRRVKQ